MKKVYISIASLLLCGQMLMAQQVSDATANILEKMPAERQAEYNRLIGQLSASGEEGVLSLVRRMHAPGQGSNAQVDYALSGLTHYVMAKGEEPARLTVANAYVKALDEVSEPETLAFLIRQIQLVGKDECVEPLARYLSDERLSGPAARALSAIGTDKAKQALLASLMRKMGTPKTQKDIVRALADTQYGEAEELLRTLLEGADENMRKELFYALSRVGSKASLPTLATAAGQVGYTMEKSGANEAYIALIKRIVAQGDTKTAEKEAKALLKKATKAGATQSREAALQILLAVKPENATKQLLSALKDDCKGYRNAALDFASDFSTKELYVEVMKQMMKAKPEEQVDILNWIGRESKRPSRRDIIKQLEIRFDLPAQQVLLDLAKDENFQVRQAAVWALVKIGNKEVIPPLADLLKSGDKQVVLLAQDALLAFPGDIDQAVARVIPSAPDAGKVAGLELLANRMADANLNTVLEQIQSGSPEVKSAAYAALRNVVAEKDFVQLCGMLETADAGAVEPVREALIASIAKMPAADRVQALSRRMIQAGDSKKHLYYRVLATTGQPDALAMIIDGWEKGTGATKEAALDALLAWNGLEAADVLFGICRATASGPVFDKALKRYIQLVATSSLTPENRLLRLREAMAIAKTSEQKIFVLRDVRHCGTFLSLMYASEFLDDADTSVRSAAAYAVMGIATAHKEEYAGENVKAILNRVIGMLDGEDARYEKDALKQLLDEMPNEVGFVSLFNGKDLTGWKGLVENPIARAKMSPAKLAKAQVKADENMRRDWKVENGLLVFDGTGYDNLCTVKQYGDFEMYVDWMLDPKGPEADAGIYLRGTPQVQIWDTARVNVGAQVGSGGLYNNQTHESKPSKVADNKLGEWNSFYIKMVGDKVTVVLNGEKVVDNVVLENYWDRKQPIFPVEQIELQAHGSKVYYRDIYVKELD